MRWGDRRATPRRPCTVLPRCIAAAPPCPCPCRMRRAASRGPMDAGAAPAPRSAPLFAPSVPAARRPQASRRPPARRARADDEFCPVRPLDELHCPHAMLQPPSCQAQGQGRGRGGGRGQRGTRARRSMRPHCSPLTNVGARQMRRHVAWRRARSIQSKSPRRSPHNCRLPPHPALLPARTPHPISDQHTAPPSHVALGRAVRIGGARGSHGCGRAAGGRQRGAARRGGRRRGGAAGGRADRCAGRRHRPGARGGRLGGRARRELRRGSGAPAGRAPGARAARARCNRRAALPPCPTPREPRQVATLTDALTRDAAAPALPAEERAALNAEVQRAAEAAVDAAAAAEPAAPAAPAATTGAGGRARAAREACDRTAAAARAWAAENEAALFAAGAAAGGVAAGSSASLSPSASRAACAAAAARRRAPRRARPRWPRLRRRAPRRRAS
jgi:hypothetical protein